MWSTATNASDAELHPQAPLVAVPTNFFPPRDHAFGQLRNAPPLKFAGMPPCCATCSTSVGLGGPDTFSADSTTILINDATTLKVRDNILIGADPMRFLRTKVLAAP